jgi:4-hydroxybutyryl-CoA dehydratase/vinylacetyl-CoA-Delta-isomerase
MATMPSERDLRHPVIGPMIEKYLVGAAGYPTEWRLRAMRLVECIVRGTSAVHYLAESMHGAGSPETQKMAIRRLAGLPLKKELAIGLAQIPWESRPQSEDSSNDSDDAGLK